MINEYRNEDIHELIKVINSVCFDCAWMSTRSFVRTPAWDDVLSNSNTNNLLLVAKSNVRLVGWCRLFVDETQCAELGIGIIKEYRFRKIGTELILESLHWAETKKVNQVKLMCHQDNLKALQFFVKRGFRVAGTENQNLILSTKFRENSYV